jgi:predicted transcriptional regulator
VIERHYSPTELARILGISRSAMHVRIREGTFAHVRLGDRILVPESAAQAVLDQCRVEPYRIPARRRAVA